MAFTQYVSWPKKEKKSKYNNTLFENQSSCDLRICTENQYVEKKPGPSVYTTAYKNVDFISST